MRSNIINVVLFLVAVAGFWLFWSYAEKHWLPQAKKNEKIEERRKQEEEQIIQQSEQINRAEREFVEQKLAQEAAAGWIAAVVKPPIPTPPDIVRAAVAGTAALAVPPKVKPAEPSKPTEPSKPPEPKVQPTLVELGTDSFNLHVLLTTRGGGVQQVVLTKFNAADRLGHEVMRNIGNGQGESGVPLYLIPGERLYDKKGLTAEYLSPTLKPGKLPESAEIDEPSYTIFHYRTPEDKYPDSYLGETEWKIVSEEHPDGGEHKVVFEAELGAPFQVKFRKTYTLSSGDYHIGFKLQIERLPGATGKCLLRYQLSGPHGLPIEGEWYTSTFRNAVVGWVDRKGTPQRQIEDSGSIAAMRGGDSVVKGENTFKYMVVDTQFFASGVAIDAADGMAKNPWAYVRATTEAPAGAKANPNNRNFEDITVRAASDVLDVEPGKPIVHGYIIYNGPAKVRLLGLMQGDRSVSKELVERYQDTYDLRTILDYHSNNWLGSFANFIWWSDIVIAVTNLMHWLLSVIHGVVGNWGVAIIVLTVIVRLMLMTLSRRQTRMNLKMMEMQKRLAPQIEDLKKRYAGDFNTFNREKMKLMMANGMNPAAQMGGCLLLLLQMPVMMGLYFCLQESIFFRLDPFLWIRNLAAPDMTLWWSEKIPFLSTPESMGGFFYLGPYLNILPIIAVSLMLWQQNQMMPPPADEQMAQQQKMMKFMMIFMAVMFYKVAAGLALYFIVGSVWGLIERRYFVKHPGKDMEHPGGAAGGEAAGGTSSGGSPAAPKGPTPNGQPESEKPKGFFGRMREQLEQRVEELKKQADEQSQRQIRNKPDDRREKRKRRK